MPQSIDHLEPEPTPPLTPAGIKAIKLSLAPLTLDESAEKALLQEILTIRDRLTNDRASGGFVIKLLPKAEQLGELSKVASVADSIIQAVRDLEGINIQTVCRIEGHSRDEADGPWDEDTRLELLELGQRLHRAAERAIQARKNEPYVGGRRGWTEICAVRSLGEAFERVTGRQASKHRGDDRTAENEKKGPKGPYFPQFVEAALADMWPEARSLDATIDVAAKIRALHETQFKKTGSSVEFPEE